MNELVIKAPAKINWSLAVTGKRADGYHLISSVMQTIGLFDTVYIKKAEHDSCTCAIDVPPTENIAYKSWLLMKEKYDLPGGLAIDIEKSIPLGGGLAGGSADAAAIFRGVNELFDLSLTYRQLADDAVNLGADIPFCIHGGLALAEGIGEKLTKLTSNRQFRLLLANPGVAVDTANVFKAYDTMVEPPIPNIVSVATAVTEGNMGQIIQSAGNMLEPAAIFVDPVIGDLKNMIAKSGLFPIMSGSGATVIGLAKNDDELLVAEKYLCNIIPWLRIVNTLTY